MDIILKSHERSVLGILKESGFEIAQEQNHFSCMRHEENGRDHALVARLNDELLVELHWDNNRHFLCFGVDYGKRPSLVFRQELEVKLAEVSSSLSVLGGYTWFSRKNMSIYSGLRVYPSSIARIMPTLYRLLLPFFIILSPIFAASAKIQRLLGARKSHQQS